jgi:hypothetical protein
MVVRRQPPPFLIAPKRAFLILNDHFDFLLYRVHFYLFDSPRLFKPQEHFIQFFVFHLWLYSFLLLLLATFSLKNRLMGAAPPKKPAPLAAAGVLGEQGPKFQTMIFSKM